MLKAKVVLDKQVFLDVVTGQAMRQIKDAIYDLKALIARAFGGLKTGRPGRFRQASAVGEAPAIQTGNLFRNLKESFPTPLTGVLLIDTPYARILEEQLDRPYCTPAITNMVERFNNNLTGKF